jgi:hypothetical protein
MAIGSDSAPVRRPGPVPDRVRAVGVRRGHGLFGRPARGAESRDERAWRMQVMWLGISLVALFVVMRIPVRWLEWIALPAYVLGIGRTAGHARHRHGRRHGGEHEGLDRIGGFAVQPSQFANVATVLMLGRVMGNWRDTPQTVWRCGSRSPSSCADDAGLRAAGPRHRPWCSAACCWPRCSGRARRSASCSCSRAPPRPCVLVRRHVGLQRLHAAADRFPVPVSRPAVGVGAGAGAEPRDRHDRVAALEQPGSRTSRRASSRSVDPSVDPRGSGYQVISRPRRSAAAASSARAISRARRSGCASCRSSTRTSSTPSSARRRV